MPTFTAKPRRVDGHRIKYEDVHMDADAAPDWVAEALDTGVLFRSFNPEGLILSNENEAPKLIKMGDWLLYSANGSIEGITATRLAEEYDLVA